MLNQLLNLKTTSASVVTMIAPFAKAIALAIFLFVASIIISYFMFKKDKEISFLITDPISLIFDSKNATSTIKILEKDSIQISFTNAPSVDAGFNLTACANNASSILSGNVFGPTTTGYWTGGNGTYNPDSTVLGSTYSPSAAEIAAGFVNLILNSSNNGNCRQVTDTVTINFTNAPFNGTYWVKTIDYLALQLQVYGQMHQEHLVQTTLR